MSGSKKSNSCLICTLLVVTPLILFSLIACDFGPQKSIISSFGLSSFDFFRSFSLSSLSQDTVSSNVSDHVQVLNVSLDKNLRNDEQLIKPELSSAERRGFLPSGLHKGYSRSEKTEAVLARVRFSIREAALNSSVVSSLNEQDPNVDPDNYVPSGPIYQNANAFYRSYQEMENLFKIYVYEEGEPPFFHNGPCKDIYTTEGRFINEIENGNHYRTKDPEEAHAFFLPYSVAALVHYLFRNDGTYDLNPMGNMIAGYVDTISRKHPYWNRSLGGDHFMLSCHDWGPLTSAYVPLLYNNSIRVLCNANTSEGFNPLKDATLPEINLKIGKITGLVGGPPPFKRSILAFFAGGLHGYIRHLLLGQWEEKDPDIQVHERLPKGISYEGMLKNSKYCICPSGYEVASPRLVEAIYAECVPVLISKSYIPPFSDVLNWKAFAVFVAVEDIPNIKKILLEIPEAKYLEMQRRVKQVQKHFVLNESPKRYDVFHMIVHSIWLRRLNVKLHEASL